MFDFLRVIFTPGNFEPHIVHFLPDNMSLVWFMVAGNALIALSYTLIPIALLYLVRKRKDIMFTPIFFLFAAFIVLCGLTHVMHIMIFWYPAYWLEAIVLALTGIISILTFFALLYVLPLALKLKTPQELEEANAKIQATQVQLIEAQVVARIGSWEWDIPKNVVTWSDELYRVYGVDKKTFGASYEGFLKLVHVDDRPRVDGIIKKAFQTGQPFEFDHIIVRPDGKVRMLHARGKVVMGQDGKPVKMYGTGQDMTERKQAEEALQSRARELEKMNELMVGRELKMKELKEEIARLREGKV